MICPQCGSWVDEGDPVCLSCGAYFTSEEEYECPVCHNSFIIDDEDVCIFCGAPIKKRDEYYY